MTLLEANGTVMSAALLTWVDERTVTLDVPVERASRVVTWLRALVDGYAATDDAFGRLTFLDAVRDLGAAPLPAEPLQADTGPYAKPYFVGAWSCKEPAGPALPRFEHGPESEAPRKTLLHAIHREMGARMVPFGGWDMPVWYTANLDEHHAVREAAGLFDVSHMGCWDVRGPEAAAFLNLTCVNDIHLLEVGESQYTAFFDVEGRPMDDLLIYQIGSDHYFVVVNAANNDKDWAGQRRAEGRGDDRSQAALRCGRPRGRRGPARPAPAGGRCGYAQRARNPGAKSKDILLALGGAAGGPGEGAGIALVGNHSVVLGGFDLIVSRTGYTGERVAYEVFVHPDQIVALWKKLLEIGEPMGLKPCGLAARDSLRIEAGLPLYGHEMAGPST